jgi:TolB-like protein
MLAVLPFANLSGDQEQEYFSDGLTEELIGSLGQLEAARLGVIARTSVMGYKGTAKPVRQITRELGVDYVLEGSVRHDGDRIRVAAQLIRASDETHVWADFYDRTLGDLLPVQTEIARAVAGELQVRLPGVAPASSPGSRQVRWDAHEAALRGRYFLEQRTAKAIHTARSTSSGPSRWSRITRSPTSASPMRTSSASRMRTLPRRTQSPARAKRWCGHVRSTSRTRQCMPGSVSSSPSTTGTGAAPNTHSTARSS